MKIYGSHASDNNLGFVCPPQHPHESNIEDMWPHPALILAVQACIQSLPVGT
jgi:hypothetical protein